MQGIVWSRPASLLGGTPPSDEDLDCGTGLRGPAPRAGVTPMQQHDKLSTTMLSDTCGNEAAMKLAPLRTHIALQQQPRSSPPQQQEQPLKRPQHRMPEWKHQVNVWADAPRQMNVQPCAAHEQQQHALQSRRDSGGSPDAYMSDATPLTRSTHPEIEEYPFSPPDQPRYMVEDLPNPNAIAPPARRAAQPQPQARGRSMEVGIRAEAGPNVAWGRSPSPPARPPPHGFPEPASEELRQQLLQQLAEMERERLLLGQQRVSRVKREQEDRLYKRYLQVQETLKRRSPTSALALADCTRIGRLYQRHVATDKAAPLCQPGQQRVQLLDAVERQEKLEELVEMEQKRVARWRPLGRTAARAPLAPPQPAVLAAAPAGKGEGFIPMPPPITPVESPVTSVLPHTPPVGTPSRCEPSAQTGSLHSGGADAVAGRAAAARAAAARAMAAAAASNVAAAAVSTSSVDTEDSGRALLLRSRPREGYQQHQPPEDNPQQQGPAILMLSRQRAKALLEQRQEQLQRQREQAEQERERAREQERLQLPPTAAAATAAPRLPLPPAPAISRSEEEEEDEPSSSVMDARYPEADYDMPDFGDSEDLAEDVVVFTGAAGTYCGLPSPMQQQVQQHAGASAHRRGSSGSSFPAISMSADGMAMISVSSQTPASDRSSRSRASPSDTIFGQRFSSGTASSAGGPAASSGSIGNSTITLGPHGPMLVSPGSSLRSNSSQRPPQQQQQQQQHWSPPTAGPRSRQLPPPSPAVQPQASARSIDSEAARAVVASAGMGSFDNRFSSGSGSYHSCGAASPAAVNVRVAQGGAPFLAGAPSLTSAASLHGSVANTPSHAAREQPELCTICEAAPSEVVFLHPSSVHRCACRDCAQGIKIGGPCPQCMEPIMGVLRVYSATAADNAKATQPRR